MNAIEKRIQELQQFIPQYTTPDEISKYWDESLQAYRDIPLDSNIQRIDSPLVHAELFDISYRGFDDTPIHGTLMLPTARDDRPLPVVVTIPGYWNGHSTSFPEANAIWCAMGFAALALDIRGQAGATGNQLAHDIGYVKGFVTQNILDRERCYYKAVAIDCVRAIDWIDEQPGLAGDRIALVGGSQGGGLVLLTAALAGSRIRAVVADIPNMCHFDYGILHSTGSLSEIADFCKKYPQHLNTVLSNLSYFDNLHLADRIQAPVLMSVGLKDTICMPETIFPVYERIRTEKHLEIMPFCGHEIPHAQVRNGMLFVKNHLSRK